MRFSAGKSSKAAPVPRQSRLTEYYKSVDINRLTNTLPVNIRHEARTFLEFLAEFIPDIEWDPHDFTVRIKGGLIDGANFRDIVSYFYGVGESWGSAYKLDELHADVREIARRNFRLVPKGADSVYATLSERFHRLYPDIESMERYFSFSAPYIRALKCFHEIIANPTHLERMGEMMREELQEMAADADDRQQRVQSLPSLLPEKKEAKSADPTPEE